MIIANIDDCENHGCMNGAKCVDGIASYSCNCPRLLTGPRCESNVTFKKDLRSNFLNFSNEFVLLQLSIT